MGAIFNNRHNLRVLCGFYGNALGDNHIGYISSDLPSQAFVIISGGDNANDKIAEAVRLRLTIDSDETDNPDVTFKVALKIATMRRSIWGIGQTNAVSATAITLKVNQSGSSNACRVGDEVTVLDGVNAGQIRHIASIAGAGTSSCVLTLDEALGSVTESGVNLQLSPFKLVSVQTVTAKEEIPDIFFDVKNKRRGKKFLLKILFTNLSTLAPELTQADLIYDDLGVL